MADTTPARVRYLMRQKGTLTYKRDVPADLRPVIGLSQWWVALKARTVAEAEQIVTRLAGEHDQLIADLRAMGSSERGARARQRVAEAAQRIRDSNTHRTDQWEALEALLAKAVRHSPDHIRHALPDDAVEEHVWAQGRVAAIDSAASGAILPANLDALSAEQIAAMVKEKRRLDGLKRNALADLAKIEDALTAVGILGKPDTTPQALTVSELAKRWLDAEGQRDITRQKWQMILRRFGEYAGDPPVSDVTRDMLATFVDAVKQFPDPAIHRPEGQSETAPPKGAKVPELVAWAKKHPQHPRIATTTVGRYIACLKALFGWAAERGLIPLSPAMYLRTPEDQRSKLEKRRPFERSELLRVVKAAESAWGNDAPRTILLKLAVYTGLRRTELVQLAPENLHEDTEAGLVIQVNSIGGRKVKTATSERTVPVHVDIADLLRGHKAIIPTGAPFLFKLAGKTTEGKADSLSEAFRYLLRTHVEINDPTVSLHSIRHSFADEARRTIPDAARHALTGHGEENRTARGYGRGMRAVDLRPLVDCMDPLGLR
jgi:integrase